MPERNDESLIHKLYRTKFISSLTYSQLYFLRKELKGCHSVLDLGSGTDSPLLHCKIPYSVGVDIFKPAVLESKNKKIHNTYIIADVNKLEFKPGSFDAVILCEMLEHLDKKDGRMLLDKAELWARKKIIVSCPNGYLAQPALYGNPYQVHHSGWSVQEMRNLGYRSYGIVGLRWKPSRTFFIFLVLWAVISVILQNITYHFPKIAFEVCHVKEKV